MQKPTPAEIVILHVIVSTALASIVGVLNIGAQYYYAHNLDLWQTLLFVGPTLIGSLGAMRLAVWHAVQSSPALAQAEQDLGNQALAEVRALASRVQPLYTHTHASPSQPAQPAPIVSRAVTTPAARPPQAIPFPPPQSTPVAHFGETGVQAAVQPPSA